MEVKDVIDRNLVLTGLSCRTKDEVLHELGNALLKNGNTTDVEDFVNDVYKREAQGQTGIGNYIAIPHSQSQFVQNAGVVIAINRNVIPWETLDGKGVKVVICFAVGNDTEGQQEHLRLLAMFARKLGNDEVVAKLIQSKTVDDVIDAFA